MNHMKLCTIAVLALEILSLLPIYQLAVYSEKAHLQPFYFYLVFYNGKTYATLKLFKITYDNLLCCEYKDN